MHASNGVALLVDSTAEVNRLLGCKSMLQQSEPFWAYRPSGGGARCLTMAVLAMQALNTYDAGRSYG